MTDIPDPLATAWAAVRAATPPGWMVGQPDLPPVVPAGEEYACLPSDGPGRPLREWTAVGDTEAGCVAEMARCLVELGKGRWPE